MTLCDAGPLYALIHKGDRQSSRCRAVLSRLRRPLMTTWPCFTEATYLAYGAGGWAMQQRLWQMVREGNLRFHLAGPEEAARMEELMERYRDVPMDLADASLVAAAEVLAVSRIFTTDSDFYVYRIHGTTPFEVVP